MEVECALLASVEPSCTLEDTLLFQMKRTVRGVPVLTQLQYSYM